MGSHSYSDICPKCNKETLMCCSETRRQYVAGECVNCGYTFYPNSEMLDLEEFNEMRENHELKPLTEEEFKKMRKEIE